MGSPRGEEREEERTDKKKKPVGEVMAWCYFCGNLQVWRLEHGGGRDG